MKVREVAGAIEEFAPLGLQESYDNSGLNVGSPDAEVSGVLICVDVTDEVVDEALAVTNKQVVDALGGLPAYKLHCSVLAEEAVKAAVKDYYDKNHIAYDHSKFPKKEDCESCCRMV